MTGATRQSGRRKFITKLADKGVGVRVLMASGWTQKHCNNTTLY